MRNLITISKRLRSQQGQALVIALIFLAIGALTLPPLMMLMGSALVQGTTFENRTASLYAADAGVEQAIWYLDPANSPLIPGGLPTNIEDPSRTLPEITIDGRTVSVTLDYLAEDIYRIESTSISSTETIKITAVVSDTYNNYTDIMNHVITCQGQITIKSGHPLVIYPSEENAPIEYYTGPWPGANELSAFYYVNTTPYDSDTLNLSDYPSGLPEILRLGPLNIVATSTSTYTLTGDVYITGDTLIGKTGHDFTLDLNGHSIYVQSNTAGNQYALEIGGKCFLTGSGSIIAEGNIFFYPNMESSEDDYIFVLSVNGKTLMQPGGEFFGTLAGATEVELKNGSITYSSPFDEYGNYKIDFPGSGLSHFWGIITWSIS
ncbi:MAG: pilus assembly protein PilZ [Dehalococcoides mccartyi]|uniref:pilus assembly PilX family protein n=2 Tax=Dehalococcoidaceae TaxID=1202464 RepID=UPI000750385B|nr:pilus assembly PilX N-terminal domain-containing protein [Dehalococcoides mccartyi]AQW62813.1 pilus assembly protein PilZ [Dehalococcoides mccartyi]OBW61339.1 MAG: pilus assembly protein PilZ [Dehalococcoides mccartyi]